MGPLQTYKELLDRIHILEQENRILKEKIDKLARAIDIKWEIINVLEKEKNELQEKIDILQRDIPVPEEETIDPNPTKEFKKPRKKIGRKKRIKPYPRQLTEKDLSKFNGSDTRNLSPTDSVGTSTTISVDSVPNDSTSSNASDKIEIDLTKFRK
jgi:hypothetical protein